jgi:hypothetical protein
MIYHMLYGVELLSLPQFCVFTIHRSVVDHSALTTSIESIKYPGNGDIQVSEHGEITIDPAIQATSHRRQTGAM